MIYKNIIYLCIFLTGATGLIFQVVWQKYLSYLIGSEARSVSLVVAIFLLGLATGYQFWGKVSERISDRKKLLKIYGYIELAIGAYAIVFPLYYSILEKIAHGGPSHLLFDILITCLALFLPTFLMGATVPLLTAVLPESSNEVSSVHARVYGVNTLGAVLGVFIGGFLLLPWLGLPMSLLLGGVINVITGVALGLNQLKGSSQEKGPIESISTRFSSFDIYSLVLVTGCMTISLEILCIRLMSLTVGSGFYVFPLVVGVFVLGLAIGSLSLYRKSFTLERMFNEMLFLLGYLGVVYLSVPYWPYWINNVRVSLVSIPTNFTIFFIAVSFLFALLTLPFLIPLGRLLPIGYSLIPKDPKNYGKICGRIYFTNALGTLLGAILIGYYLLYWLNIDILFKLVVVMFAALFAILLFKEKKYFYLLGTGILTLLVLLLPFWERYNHQIGLFRNHRVTYFNFAGLLNLPDINKKAKIIYFKDGPNTTVTVSEEAHSDPLSNETRSLSILVNGKSDGNTFGDHSTMNLLSTLPYLFSTSDKISAAVVGLGTGMSAGVLAAAKDVTDVTVLEISSNVIEAMPLFDPFTENLSTNPKASFVDSDAFRFFSKSKKKFDVIVSEPSNPWVSGVENLYTPEFYEKAKQGLTQTGIFIQWIHTYSIDQTVLGPIFQNISRAFPYLKFYKIGPGDVAIMASMTPFRATPNQERWNEELLQRRHKLAGLHQPEQLDLLLLYTETELRILGAVLTVAPHDSHNPSLSYRAAIAFFTESKVDLENLLSPEISRFARKNTGEQIQKGLSHFKNQTPEKLQACEPPVNIRRQFVCSRLSELITKQGSWEKADKLQLDIKTLELYRDLRQQGLIAPDISFLEAFAKNILKSSEQSIGVALLIAQEFAKENEAERANALIAGLVEKNILSASQAQEVYPKIAQTKQWVAVLLKGLSQN